MPKVHTVNAKQLLPETRSWKQRVMATLNEARKTNDVDFKRLLSYWYVTGKVIDRGQADGSCGLCQHRGTRFDFEIAQFCNEQGAFQGCPRLDAIGSRCITQFGKHKIAFVSAEKVLFDQEAKSAAKSLNILARSSSHIASAKRFIHQLSEKKPFFGKKILQGPYKDKTNKDKFLDLIQRSGITLEQYKLLAKMAEEAKIAIDQSWFNLCSSDKGKQQEASMTPDDKHKFAGLLSRKRKGVNNAGKRTGKRPRSLSFGKK